MGTDDALPDAELEVLACLWQKGEATARDIREAMAAYRPLTHSAVSTLLARLQEKRLVARRKGPVGKAFLFRATSRPRRTRRRLVGDLVERVFGGDPLAVVSSLFETRPPSAQDLDQLEKLLGQLRSNSAGGTGSPFSRSQKGETAMNTFVEEINRFADEWWFWTLHAAWQSALVGCVILAVVACARRWPAPVRYWLLVIALIKFAVPPLWSARPDYSAVLPSPTGHQWRFRCLRLLLISRRSITSNRPLSRMPTSASQKNAAQRASRTGRSPQGRRVNTSDPPNLPCP